METFVIALAAFIPMLLLLVVVHELGHFWTAKAFGVKVLEFESGIRRGRGAFTRVAPKRCSPVTRYASMARCGRFAPAWWCVFCPVKPPMASWKRGTLSLEIRGRVEVSWARWGASPAAGARIRMHTRRRGPRWTNCNPTSICATRGRVREVQSDRIVLADMVYSVNWLPLGGFVRLSGENNPEAPRSLARRGLGQRAVVLVARLGA